LVVAGAVAGLLFELLLLLELLPLELLFELLLLLELLLLFDLAAGAGAAVLVSAATGVADFGASAAIDAAAKPMVNNAVMIRDPDLVIKSPKRVVLVRGEEYARSKPVHRDEDHFTNAPPRARSPAILSYADRWMTFFLVRRTCHTR
jgi:hypothetical protein